MNDNESHIIDIIIVGGGILGLATGFELLKKNPKISVAIAEKERYLGEHTSGRNSEVLHAGFYYPENSLKHIHCVEGNRLWREYIRQNNLKLADIGKYVVARKDESERFDNLYQKAIRQSPGIRKTSKEEVASLQNIVQSEYAFFSSSTAVLNTAECLGSLKNNFESLGGMFVFKSKVENLKAVSSGFEFTLNNELMKCHKLINAAGLGAVEIRNQITTDRSVSNCYVKGRYLTLSRKLKVKSLVYPIPPEDLLGLGVHLTIDQGGQFKFGPDTEYVNEIDYSVNESLINELYPQISRIFKDIKKEELSLGYSGIRPKIKIKDNIYTDFLIQTEAEHGTRNYYEFLGIESPGFTAALSLAKYLSDKI